MKPSVTIGVCVKNSEKTIRDAIASLLYQTFPIESMELIIVDGNSLDRTIEIAQDALKETKMDYRILLEDKGLGHARQMVVEEARGNYIIWVDGDMTLPTDYVKELVAFMKSHSDVGVAKGSQSVKGGNLLATLEACSRLASKLRVNDEKKGNTSVLGTSGSIYRVEAIRQAGGFDENIKGYGEDFDAEIKIRSAGWTFRLVDVEYSDYERGKLTWGELWQRYWVRGYHNHYFYHKNKGLMKHYRMFPPAAFLNGILQSREVYQLTRQKLVFLLPVQYLFKMTAWYEGFLRSHLNSYEPGPSNSTLIKPIGEAGQLKVGVD
jgi:glycosyltransferase involved in cell wall biosynthesis